MVSGVGVRADGVGVVLRRGVVRTQQQRCTGEGTARGERVHGEVRAGRRLGRGCVRSSAAAAAAEKRQGASAARADGRRAGTGGLCGRRAPTLRRPPALAPASATRKLTRFFLGRRPTMTTTAPRRLRSSSCDQRGRSLSMPRRRRSSSPPSIRRSRRSRLALRPRPASARS